MIVGKGKGKKWSNGQITDQDAVMYFVSKKKPVEELDPQEVIPQEEDGQPTDVYEVGDIEFMRKEEHRPIKGGISMGHPSVTAGTLGCICQSNGEDVILTNSHVGCPSGAKIGDWVLQPSKLDGGRKYIGHVLDVEQVKTDEMNYIDSCIIKPEVEYKKEVEGLSNVGSKITRVKVGESIKKSGRTTGLTVGTVLATDVKATVWFRINGEKHLTYWDDQVFVRQQNYNFIAGGDSGSLVVDNENNPCGLVYAASPIVGIFNNIDRVAQRHNLSFGDGGWVASEFTDTTEVKTKTRLNFRTYPMGEVISVLNPDTKLKVISNEVKNVSGYKWINVKINEQDII